MPSFEHADKKTTHSHEDSLYQPGKNRPSDNQDQPESTDEALIPTTQLITRRGDVAAAAELAAAASEERRAAAEAIANRPPCYIDAHLGNPAPTIQQSIRVKPQPTGPRKPGLRGRNRPAGSSQEGVKGGSTFGEVESPSVAQETLSGDRVQNGKLSEPGQRQRPQRERRPRTDTPESSDTPAQSEAGEHRGPRDESRPPRKRSRNRNRNRDNRNGDDTKPAQREPHAPRERQGDQKPRNAPRTQASAASKKPDPKAPEPSGFMGKIKKMFGGLFGNNSAQQRPTESTQSARSEHKPHFEKSHGRPEGRRPGQGQGQGRGPRPHNQERSDDDPTKPRRRRGGRRRGGQNRSRPGQGGPQSKQGNSQNNQSQSSGDAS